MLNRDLSRLVLEIAPAHDASAVAPETFDAINRAYIERGSLLVWDGASERTIWGDPRINHAFRAWHDLHHIAGQHDFTLAGEIATMHAQCDALRARHGDNEFIRYACRVLDCEVAGQAKHFATYGEFPADQIGFTLEHLK